jgi:hypothetical protein
VAAVHFTTKELFSSVRFDKGMTEGGPDDQSHARGGQACRGGGVNGSRTLEAQRGYREDDMGLLRIGQWENKIAQ